jgi:F1F0 ATPase subunit 2
MLVGMEMDQRLMNLPSPYTLASWPALSIALIFLSAGFVAGFVHFSLLRKTADDVAAGLVSRPILQTLARFAITIAALYLASRSGAVALVAATLGVVAARALVLRPCRKAAK